ncbi:hypothetical protein NEUTE1DRAFT_120779 [Neurospora tetrasperma FGSC 2508]|uniref:Azaphilone pigments biosynthesis cluster protein L N-terminal domain-containing protein n=1 Tax=Neurospora tetrasperma (strain FGSC 2508 / ATCC MYA-4615 / P0657) TaxID=510951 RepID=F8MHU4_NEUT8|nr:uncharacterized protein NEUTE1DRAFT_120779 [Neurospora tetrasperma FGSC 2508]EGO58853.1 hypothetical protein NEUTE1DRAFT_120779 [Neurospora tetrasperma FGSC 2508]EGZ72953.1 hypothetical protein NEUTE2DRAFT_85555 [Neurospora tetrasperma FGSC 2509]
MDPVSIASAAFALAGGIIKCSVSIAQFVRQAKHARNDLDRVTTELAVLSGLLTPLTVALNLIGSQARGLLPSEQLAQIEGPIKECDLLVTRINEYISLFKNDAIWTRAKRAMCGKGHVEDWCESLEVHKQSLNLSLLILSLSDTQEIRRDTTEIRGTIQRMHKTVREIRDRVVVPRRSRSAPLARPPRDVQQWVDNISTLWLRSPSGYGSEYRSTIPTRIPSSTASRYFSLAGSENESSALRRQQPTRPGELENLEVFQAPSQPPYRPSSELSSINWTEIYNSPTSSQNEARLRSEVSQAPSQPRFELPSFNWTETYNLPASNQNEARLRKSGTSGTYVQCYGSLASSSAPTTTTAQASPTTPVSDTFPVCELPAFQ